VVITGRTVQNALQVPSSALLPSQDASSSVMIAGSDGVAHKRVVTVGIRTPESVQITDGLTTSDNVITEGSYGLDDGAKITLAADKPDEGADKPAAGSKE
jgi:HlyD family secretion protein